MPPAGASQEQQEGEPRERRTASLELVSWQLGRLEEIMREGRAATERAIDRLTAGQEDHERRIGKLEVTEEARLAAKAAASEARAEVLSNEDRWGRTSPRAIVVASLAGGGGLVALLDVLLK